LRLPARGYLGLLDCFLRRRGVMKVSDFIKKIIWSIVALFVLWLSFTSTLDHLLGQSDFIGGLDRKASQYLSDATKRAATAFVIARGINAAISVIQNSSVNAQPGGVGVTAGIGQILDPVDDLVEQFSSIMLLSTVSLGIQKILIDIGNAVGFKILLSISMLIIILGIWLDTILKLNLISLGYKLLMVSILVRFIVPTIAVASGASYDQFLSVKYTEAIGELEKSRGEISDINFVENSSNKDPGVWDKLKETYAEVVNAIDIKARLKRLSDLASNWSDYIFSLMEVFIIQTILVPLIVLYGMIKLFKAIADTNIIK
jgi:hypothetical protein